MDAMPYHDDAMKFKGLGAVLEHSLYELSRKGCFWERSSIDSAGMLALFDRNRRIRKVFEGHAFQAVGYIDNAIKAL